MSNITFHHVALSVREISTSTEFYGAFGFKVLRSWVSEDGTLAIAHLLLDTSVLELFCFRNNVAIPATATSLESDLPVIGTKHFGLRVEDVEAFAEALRGRGVEALEPPKLGRTGIKYFFVRDPDGILVELVEDHAIPWPDSPEER